MGLPKPSDKRRFVRELLKSVGNDILSKTDFMPLEWDGVELRRFVAQRFDDWRIGDDGDFGRRRKRDYENAVRKLPL